MISLISFILVGPLLGLLGAATLNYVLANHLSRERNHLWPVVAAELFVLYLISFLTGTVSLLLAVPILLLYAAHIASSNDPVFARYYDDWKQRGATGLKYAAGYGIDAARFVAARFSEKPASKKKSVFQGGYESYGKPAESPAANQAEDTDERIRVIQPSPSVAVAPVVQRPAHSARSSQAQSRLSEKQVLEQLLLEVTRLQSWAARPEAEREALAQLTSEARNTELALTKAVSRLKSGTVDWKEICTHIDGLKKHNLPAELSHSLDGLAAERANELAENRQTVGQLSEQLRGKASDLKTELHKPVLSPEEVIRSADAAIAAAENLGNQSAE